MSLGGCWENCSEGEGMLNLCGREMNEQELQEVEKYRFVWVCFVRFSDIFYGLLSHLGNLTSDQTQEDKNYTKVQVSQVGSISSEIFGDQEAQASFRRSLEKLLVLKQS